MKDETIKDMAKEVMLETVQKVLGGETEVRNYIHTSLQNLLAELLNAIMLAERERFLKMFNDVGNGFRERNLETAMGKLNIKVPRSRELNFRPFIISQPYKRGDASYSKLLESLIVNGYSPQGLKNVLNRLELGFSEKEVEAITEELRNRYYEFIQKELPSDIFAMYIDAYRGEMKDPEKNKVAPTTIYTIIGIDPVNWKKQLLGFYVRKGSERKEVYLEIFNNLISRGLKRVSLIVSDGFSGLKDAISELFPNTEHQLCIVHFKRNITRNMAKDDAKSFKIAFDNLRTLPFENALSRFEDLIRSYGKKYKTFMSHLWMRRSNYLTFLKFPEPIHKLIRTTNSCENFHRSLERIRYRMSGFFQNEEVLGINIILQLDKLYSSRWANPLPLFKACEYELLQFHKAKFRYYNSESADAVKIFEKELASPKNKNLLKSHTQLL